MEGSSTKYVVFDTPGLIDMRSFTLMGVSVKPAHDKPIGLFGTGLKYAAAVLVRMGADLAVYRGLDEKWTFRSVKDEFRGSEIEHVQMVRYRGKMLPEKVIHLPYTTTYGRNWLPWMVVRELEANTRDELGYSFVSDNDHGGSGTGHTRIVVRHADFLEAYNKLDEIFLAGASVDGSGVEALAGESKFLYWRGMKVFELPKPSSQTYNFLDPMQLTEDRTLQSVYDANSRLGIWLQRHDDESMIRKTLTAGDKYWEHNVDLNQFVAPSRAFHNAAIRIEHNKNRASGVGAYYKKYDERVTLKSFSLMKAHPVPWRVLANQVVDANGKTVFDAPYDYKGRWTVTGQALIIAAGMGGGKTKDTTIAVEEVDGAEMPPAMDTPADEVPF